MGKNKAETEAPRAETAGDAEGKRIKELALKKGVISRARRVCNDIAAPSKALVNAHGKDIVKRNSTRKGRFMVLFPGKLAPAAAGNLGSLAKLDTRNPTMYMDFPEGRLKFFGTIVYPKNKYMTLSFQPKNIVCEDVFDSMIVFSRYAWVGTVEENPEEIELPMPSSLKTPKHTGVSFLQGASAPDSKSLPSTGGAAKKEKGAGGGVPEADDDDEDADATIVSTQTSNRPKREVVANRKSYNLDSDEEGSDGEEAEEAEEEEGGGGVMMIEDEEEAEVIDLDDDDGGGGKKGEKSKGKSPAKKAGGSVLDMLQRGAAKQGGTKSPAKSTAKNPIPKKRKSMTFDSDESEEDDEDDDDDDEGSEGEGDDEEEDAPPPPAKKKKKESKAPQRNKSVVLSSDDEGGGSGSEFGGEGSDGDVPLTQGGRRSGRAKAAVKYRDSGSEASEEEGDDDSD
mmetsp:Transcript_51247/g.163854  ORF Transcript_51247/g.163854 Transcript_51247/m.163854 type:complete len:453 (+) Transcript_51247:80-1438(+)